MLVFISGPYRNTMEPYAAFNDAARRIWRLGAVPFNPVAEGELAADFMADDDFIARYCKALRAGCFSAIYLLNGWDYSVGARKEFAAAKWADLPVLTPSWCDETILRVLEKCDVIGSTQHTMEDSR